MTVNIDTTKLKTMCNDQPVSQKSKQEAAHLEYKKKSDPRMAVFEPVTVDLINPKHGSKTVTQAIIVKGFQ